VTDHGFGAANAAGRAAFAAVLALSLGMLPASLLGQTEAEVPILNGRLVIDGRSLPDHPVALHQVGAEAAGEIATEQTDAEGQFQFRLPYVPDPDGSRDVFFISARYRGILYFGAPVTDVRALDSLQVLQVFDTASAPAGGQDLPISVRNIFVEESEAGWQITDLFEVRNPGTRTVIASEGGAVWSYPLMAGADSVELGDGDLGPDAFSFRAGRIWTTAPIPPGERLYVFRYRVAELTRLPLPGETAAVEVFIREPALGLQVRGLEVAQPVEIEAGSVFHRFTGSALSEAAVVFEREEPGDAIPLEWMAVLVALGLGLLGVWAVGRQPSGDRTA